MILAPRYLPRLAATVGLFTRYGLADFADRSGLRALVAEEEGDGDGASPEKAAAFRRRLVELGPAYIKLGQVLSTRPDLIPETYVEELARLQDDVDPIPWEHVAETIEAELGARLSKLFDSFEREPLGTASLGQVHAAELRGGRRVVVKVQRPNIRELLADDLEFVRELATFFTRHTQVGARIDMLGIIAQLERALLDELDYRIEARNAATFRRALAEFPRLLVPKVIEAYTSERVLTTERVRGVKISEISPFVRLDYDLARLADQFAKGYLKQVTIDGHFHADPHPGNVFLVLPGRVNPLTPSEVVASERRNEIREPTTPLSRIEREAQESAAPLETIDEPRLALIDFGMTARLAPAMRDRIVRLLSDLAENRGEAAAETMIEMGEANEGFDRTGFVRESASLIAHNHDRTIGEIQAGEVLYALIGIAFEKGLKPPSELTLLAKTLFSLDAVTLALDPTYSPVTTIREYAGQIMNEQARRDLSPRRFFQMASQASELLNALPHRLDLITNRMAANDVAFRVDSPQLGSLLKGLQKIANRIFIGLVLTGLLIASAMLMPYRRTLGTTGFIVSAIMVVYMVGTILVSDRRGKGE